MYYDGKHKLEEIRRLEWKLNLLKQEYEQNEYNARLDMQNSCSHRYGNGETAFDTNSWGANHCCHLCGKKGEYY